MAGEKEPRSLAARLKAARSAAVELNKATDELNRAFADAEAAIVALNLGVSTAIEIHHPERGTADEEAYLAFRKHDGRWCLLVDTGVPSLDHWSTVPLLKASRGLRIEAVERLPGLVDKLIEQTQRQVQEVTDCVARVGAFAAQLKEAQS